MCPEGCRHGQRLQRAGRPQSAYLLFKLYMVAATQLIASFFFFSPLRAVGVAAPSRFFGPSSSWSVLSSQTQFPPGRFVRNFAAFCAYFTIGKFRVFLLSSAGVLGACTRFLWAAQL